MWKINSKYRSPQPQTQPAASESDLISSINSIVQRDFAPGDRIFEGGLVWMS